jgi:predicted permease
MVDVALSLVPVFTLIALGFLLRRAELLKPEQWLGIERLTYFVLFPPLLFMSIVNGAFAGGEALKLAIGLTATVGLMAGLLLGVQRLLPMPGPAFTSVFQAGIRWNGFVALGVISSLHGQPGVALSAVAFAALSPITQAMSLLVATRQLGGKPEPMNRMLIRLALNPLVIAALAACLLVAYGMRPSQPIAQTLNLLGDATVSLGLICVGAGLDIPSLKGARLPLAWGVVLRLWIMPGIAAALLIWTGLSGMMLSVGVVCAASPVATSAYILSRQHGGDAPLMGNLITLTTLLSILTLPATILIVHALTRL